MSVKFFINAPTIGKLGAAAVGYATADRLGLNRTTVATVLIFSATIGTWTGQAIRAIASAKYPNPQRKEDQPKVANKRYFFDLSLVYFSYPLLTKTAQIAAGKFGSPLSFIQCAGIVTFYSNAIGVPLGLFIGYCFPSIKYK